MCPVQLSVDVEATLKYALENLSLDATTMAEYEKENGIATKGATGLNMHYHVFKVSQLPVFRDSLDMKKTCSVAADGTSSNTVRLAVGVAFFKLLQQWVTRLRLDGRRILLNKGALVLSSAAKSVDFIHKKFQPVLEELFRFISKCNSAVRHKSMQAAFGNFRAWSG